jgi:hypothetical protein
MSKKDSAVPHFYMGARENAAKTREMGRPMFDDVEMVRVIIPGDRLANFVDEVSDEHRNRWPDHYAAFKRGELRASTGTPLEHWPPMTTARVAEMKALNIFSVEDLANLSDAAVLRLGMGGRELRAQAQAYISSAKDNAAMTALVAEVERLKQMLENRPASDPAPEPEKRRGRPPRAASEPASETIEA